MSLKLPFTIISFFITISIFAQSAERKFVVINNKKMAYKTFDMEARKSGEPVIVFESGFGSGGGNFDPVLLSLPKKLASIVYDRNGIGESEMDGAVKTDADVIRRLHVLLATLKIPPPYLLVGHSVGGAYIRLYSDTYPDEVCGLFFIDPTDFMLTKAEDDQVKKVTSSATGYRDIWKINVSQMVRDTSLPAGLRNEADRELAESTPEFFRNYTSLAPLKDIPVTVMISYNKPIEHYENEMNKNLKLGINIMPWWKELDKLRIAHYVEMIAKNHHSSVVLLPGYSHGIHHQDPKLVAVAIAGVYDNCLKATAK